MGKSLGSKIPSYSLMGKYLGYSMYVLFVLSYHLPVTQYCLFYHSFKPGEGLVIFLGLPQQQEVLEYTRPQLYNKIQIYDLGE